MAGQMPVVVSATGPCQVGVIRATSAAFACIGASVPSSSLPSLAVIIRTLVFVAKPAGYLRYLSPAMLMPIPPLYCSCRSKFSSCQSRMGDGQLFSKTTLLFIPELVGPLAASRCKAPSKLSTTPRYSSSSTRGYQGVYSQALLRKYEEQTHKARRLCPLLANMAASRLHSGSLGWVLPRTCEQLTGGAGLQC